MRSKLALLDGHGAREGLGGLVEHPELAELHGHVVDARRRVERRVLPAHVARATEVRAAEELTHDHRDGQTDAEIEGERGRVCVCRAGARMRLRYDRKSGQANNMREQTDSTS